MPDFDRTVGKNSLACIKSSSIITPLSHKSSHGKEIINYLFTISAEDFLFRSALQE